MKRKNDYAHYRPKWANMIASVHLFLAACRRGQYPNTRWLAEQRGVSHITAKRMIAVLRRDLGAPLRYSRRNRGWYLSNPRWYYRGDQ